MGDTWVRILLIDDDPSGALTIAELLRYEDQLAFEHVRDLTEATPCLRTGQYDLILLSLTLSSHPGLTGFALLQALVPRAPVMVIAPPDGEALALKALQQGAADYLLRGQIYRTVLHRTIRHAIEQHRARERQAQMERALQWERDFTSAVIETAGCAILVLDKYGRIVQFNQTCEHLSGYTMREVRGLRPWDVLGVADERELAIANFELLISGQYPVRYEGWWQARDRSTHLIAWSKTALLDAEGAVEFVVMTGLPVTERRRAEEALRGSESKYRSLFEESRDAIFMTDVSGMIIECNRATAELLGYAHELVGCGIETLFASASDRQLFRQEWMAKGTIRDFEARLRHESGDLLWGLLSISERRLPGGALLGYQGIIHDITDRKRAEERLIHNAYHDTLTALPNRALFSDRLDRALARWHRHAEDLFAVLFIDLDRFKVVNDSMGHAAGDELLIRIAEMVGECVREEDTLARLGGDEFAILLDRVDGVTDAVLVAERIHSALEQPIAVAGQHVFMSCSIGIALPATPEDKPDDLLRNADIAMYRAKSDGPARQEVYNARMHSAAVTTLELDTALRVALQQGQFVLHYQPIYTTNSGRVAGFEALLRWQHPRRGLLLPSTFVPRAEETNLIVPIGRWVMRSVIEQLRAWLDLHDREQLPRISVNVSGKQLSQADFVSDIAALLAETGVPGDRLMFELTETSLMQNPESCALAIGRLRELGVRFCIDDFGTGYSSLSYLHRLPIDELKIDRSFIARLEHGAEASELVGVIVSLAASFGMDVVAEGVETEGQLSSVRQLGTRFVQGFYLSRPLEPSHAAGLIASV